MSLLLMSLSSFFFLFSLFLVFQEIERFLIHVKSRVNFADEDAVNKRWKEKVREKEREKERKKEGKEGKSFVENDYFHSNCCS